MASYGTLTRRGFVISAAAAGLWSVAPASLRAQPAERRFSLIGFTKPFQKLSFDETADTVAEIGWDGIECPVRPGGQIEPERAGDELPRLVEALAQRGKEVTLLATAITSADQPHAEGLLRTAAALGIRRYRLGFMKYDLDRSLPEQLREIRARLGDLAQLNAELGLQAGFQNHSGSDVVGAPVWDIWSVIQDLDPRWMGVCFDIGHATLEGGMSWPIEARLVQSRLSAVFVKDFRWERDGDRWRAQWVMLGQGMVDPKFFQWLAATDYRGPICQHHEYDHGQGKPMIAKMQQDLKVLRQWLGA